MSKHRLSGRRIPVPREYRHHRPAHRAYAAPWWQRLAWPFVGPSRRWRWAMASAVAAMVLTLDGPVDSAPRQGVKSPPSERRPRRPEMLVMELLTTASPRVPVTVLTGKVDEHGEDCTWCQEDDSPVAAQLYVDGEGIVSTCLWCAADVVRWYEGEGRDVTLVEVSECE